MEVKINKKYNVFKKPWIFSFIYHMEGDCLCNRGIENTTAEKYIQFPVNQIGK